MDIDGVKIDYLGHSGFIIESEDMRIAIDPYQIVSNVKSVDLILITHEHSDHCSVKDMEKIAKKGTIVIGPAHIQSNVMKVEGLEVQPIEVNDEVEFGNIKIEAVPSYNLNKYRDVESKKVFHPKSEGYLGYLVKIGDVIFYHAGDSDFIPEMQKLTGYGKKGKKLIALLPVSGTYVMDVDEAIEAASLLKPHLTIPMHYGSVVGTREDAESFVSLCIEKGIRAEILEKI